MSKKSDIDAMIVKYPIYLIFQVLINLEPHRSLIPIENLMKTYPILKYPLSH